MRNTNKKGFTIVELVVVVAVIAILAAVMIPTFSGIIDKTKQSVDQQLVRQINTILATEAVDGTGCADINEVKEVLSANGFNKDIVPAYKDHTFGFIAAKNVFVLIKDEKVVYPENYAQDNLDGVELYLTGDNLIFSIPEGENAGNYINSGAIKNGYIELAEGTYNGLKYGMNVGEVESESTHTNGYPEYVKLNKIGNLTIGGEGAVLNGFTLNSGRSIHYGSDPYYTIQKHEIETLKFANVTFTGRFYTDNNNNVSIKNLVFENVTFDMTDADTSVQAVAHIYSKTTENITFKNCKFINVPIKAIEINTEDKCAKSVTVVGCEFDTIGRNAIQISDTSGVETLVFTNNTIKNTGDRAIRVGGTVFSKATISGNTLENACDTNGEVIKFSSVTEGATVVVENNTHNGNAVVWDGLIGK